MSGKIKQPTLTGIYAIVSIPRKINRAMNSTLSDINISAAELECGAGQLHAQPVSKFKLKNV